MTKADSELPTRREFDRERPWQRFSAWPASPYVGVFILALSVRLLYLHQIGDSILFETLVGDGRGFDDWAQRILSADQREGTFYQPPLYPYFLAAIYRFFGHDTHAVRVVQFVLGSASCVLLAGAVRAFFSQRAGLIAGVLLAIYPLSIYFDGIIQKTSLAQFFGALLLLLLGQVVDIRELVGSPRRWPWAPRWVACLYCARMRSRLPPYVFCGSGNRHLRGSV